MRRDWIQSPGETSLNLPHRLLIEIVTENPEESDIDVMAQWKKQNIAKQNVSNCQQIGKKEALHHNDMLPLK